MPDLRGLFPSLLGRELKPLDPRILVVACFVESYWSLLSGHAEHCTVRTNNEEETLVITQKDKDSLEVQELNRKGGFAQGDSPKYVYKRVEK